MAALDIKWRGLDKLIVNLDKEITKMEGASIRGLWDAARHVRTVSQSLTPVITGNLRNSAFALAGKLGSGVKGDLFFKTVSSMSGMPVRQVIKKKRQMRIDHRRAINEEKSRILRSIIPTASVGYSASYALKVHENPRSGRTGGESPSGKKYARWSTVGQYKFLEQAFVTEKAKILKIIKNRVKIK